MNKALEEAFDKYFGDRIKKEKDTKKLLKGNNIIVEHEKIDLKELDKMVAKALELYKSTMLIKPDKVFFGSFHFPRIMYGDRIVDIEKEYKGGHVVATVIGVIPFIVYFSKKGGELNPYFHEFKPNQVFLCVDPSDTKRIFLAFTEPIEFDITGIK